MMVLCLSLIVALSVQFTKLAIQTRFDLGERLEIIPGFFNLSYVRNTGAAWGVLQGLNHWLVGLSVVILAVIIIFRRHFITDTMVHRIATGLMLGGIVGNLIDRVKLGYVVDFLDFHLGGHHFPSFNVADSAICVGVGFYLLSQFLASPGRETPRGVSTGPDESRV